MKLSVVTTMYYSSNYLMEFYNRTASVLKELKLSYELIFVDDGSPDKSLEVALQLLAIDANVKIVELSKNFGHQRAIMTGLQHSKGDYVFLIDCDLEEPPELLKEFWEKITTERELDAVYGVQKSRKGKWFERISGRLFYKILSLLSSVKYQTDSLTARIMSRAYVDSVLKFSEKELDIWSIFVFTGFRQAPMPVVKSYKGSSTYTFRKRIKHALEVVVSFSHRPLYLTFIFGIASFVIALLNVTLIVYDKIILGADVEGWASILASVWLIGGMIFLVLGIFGIYLSNIFLEIKNRPLTIIRNVYSR